MEEKFQFSHHTLPDISCLKLQETKPDEESSGFGTASLDPFDQVRHHLLNAFLSL